MIRPLRSLHRALWTALALLLPTLLVLALALRHAEAPASRVPPELESAAAPR